MNVIPFFTEILYQCVCPRQLLADWEEVLMPVAVTPPHPLSLLSPPATIWNTIWSQQMGNRAAGGPTVMCVKLLLFKWCVCASVCMCVRACVCGAEDSSRLIEAQPRAAETRQSAHSWQLCQQHSLLHQEAQCDPQCSFTSGPVIAPPNLRENTVRWINMEHMLLCMTVLWM